MNDHLNIAIVNRHRDDTIGGSELQCDFIATELSKLNHQVSYIVPGGNGHYNRNYQVLPCLNDGKNIADTVLSVNPDIVYWRYNKKFFLEAVKGIKKRDVPIIFSSSSVPDVKPGFHVKKMKFRKKVKVLARRYWNHRGFKYIDAVVVNNKSHLNLLPVTPQQYIPNGMINEWVDFKWDKPYCAWISSLKQIKRPELFIKLAKKLDSLNMDFIMVGAIQEEEYKWVVNKNNLPHNVHYLGVKTPEEVNGILKGAKLHIHTCYPEGFPNVFIQAWMQGTPSISLGFDPSGYITDHKLGEHADNDFESFIRSVKNFLDNDRLRSISGDNAKIFAESMFNINTNVGMLVDLMKDVMINYKN